MPMFTPRQPNVRPPIDADDRPGRSPRLSIYRLADAGKTAASAREPGPPDPTRERQSGDSTAGERASPT